MPRSPSGSAMSHGCVPASDATALAAASGSAIAVPKMPAGRARSGRLTLATNIATIASWRPNRPRRPGPYVDHSLPAARHRDRHSCHEPDCETDGQQHEGLGRHPRGETCQPTGRRTSESHRQQRVDVPTGFSQVLLLSTIPSCRPIVSWRGANVQEKRGGAPVGRPSSIGRGSVRGPDQGSGQERGHLVARHAHNR